MKIYKENAGSPSLISPLDQPSVKEKLTKYTRYCLNTGDGDGGGSGGLYHMCYGIASIGGAKSWMQGCTVQELRDSAGKGEPLATFLRHGDWLGIGVAGSTRRLRLERTQ